MFGFPAITIPDGNKKTNQRGRITVADVTDFLNPKHYNITIDPMADPAYEYHQPVWMNDKEFIVGRGFLAGPSFNPFIIIISTLAVPHLCVVLRWWG